MRGAQTALPPITEQPPCRLCGGLDSRRCSLSFGDGRLWQCRRCGLRFVHPQPSLDDLPAVYDETYFRSLTPGQRGYDDYEGDSENLLRTFRRRMGYVQRLHPHPGRLLDIGCAHGFFLQAGAEAGWEPYGIDISAHAVAFARRALGDNVRLGLFLDVSFPVPDFQAITMWDYLEHTLDPVAEVAKARELLSDDGVLAVYTPDVRSLPARIMGPRWLHYKYDEHLFYFSRKTIRQMLEAQGFRIVSTRYEGKYVSLDFFLRRLALYLPLMKGLRKRVLNGSWGRGRSLYINPLDFMLVLAKKAGRP